MQERHALLTGDSGSGKTTRAREVHANCPSMSIVVNHSDESGFAGETVTTMKAAVKATKQFDTVSDVRLNLKVDDVDKGLRIAQRYGVDMFDTFQSNPNFNGVQVIVPEGHKALPEGKTPKEHPGKWMAHQGRSSGIKLILESQTPRFFDYASLPQFPYWVWVGPPAGFHDGFLNAHSWIPEEKLPRERYHYVTMDKRGNILFKGKTSETFGVAMG